MTRRRKISLGPMRHVIDIEEPTRTFDDIGEDVASWAAISGGAGIRCEVRPATTYEMSAYAHNVGGISHMVLMRVPPFTVTKRLRLNYAGRILEIRGVMQPDERGRFLQIQAQETISGGGGSDGD